MFKNALAHVQRNYRALLIYIGIVASYFAVRVIVETNLIGKLDAAALSSSDKLYLLVSGIVTALVVAIAQTLAFSRFASDIDRPHWKLEAGFGPFFRYCSFWFTLNYINIAAFLLIVVLPMSDQGKASFGVFRSVYELYLIPFGAVVMFYGNTGRAEIGAALNTMLLQFPRFLLVGLITLIAYVFLESLQAELDPNALPLLQVIGAYVNCLIFAFTWEICRFNRDAEDDSDDMEY